MESGVSLGDVMLKIAMDLLIWSDDGELGLDLLRCQLASFILASEEFWLIELLREVVILLLDG